MSQEQKSPPSLMMLEDAMQSGHKALSNELWETALKFYENATSLKPHYVEAWLGKAVALKGLGKIKEAIKTYKTALEIDQRNLGAWTGLIETLHQAGMFKEEVEACDCLLRVRPKTDEALLNKGVALHALGKLEKALECFEQLVSRRPENVSALNNRGAVLMRLNRLDEALDSFNQALALSPQHEDVQRNRCLVFLSLKRYSEAIDTAADMLSLREEGWLWMVKGLAHAELREVHLALEALERAKELEPDLDNLDETLKRIRKLRASIEKSEKKIAEKQQKEIEEAKAPLPQIPVASQGLAVILTQLGYPTEAIQIWKESMDKNSPEDWIGFSVAFATGKDLDSSESCLRQAARLGASHAAVAISKQIFPDKTCSGLPEISVADTPVTELYSLWWEANELLERGRSNDALDFLENVLKKRDKLELGWNWLGMIRALSGKHAEAEDAFREAVESDGRFATAWSNLGAVMAISGKMQDAVVALKKALEIDPRHLEALHNLGIIENRQGNIDEARRLLKMALKTKERPQTWIVLAQINEKANLWRDAMYCYKKCLQLERNNRKAKSGLARARGRLGARKKKDNEKAIKRIMKAFGTDEKLAKALVKDGYTTIKSIRKASTEDLVKVKGVDGSVADWLKEAAAVQERKKGKDSPK